MNKLAPRLPTTPDVTARSGRRAHRAVAGFALVALVVTGLIGRVPAGAAAPPSTGAATQRVTVELVFDGATARPPVEAAALGLGARVTGRAPGIVQIELPAQAVGRLTAAMTAHGVTVREPLAVSVRPDNADQPEQYGPTTGAADSLTNALAWHTAGITGAGVRIGVIDYFDTMYWDVDEHGPLPIPNVNARCLHWGSSCNWSFSNNHDAGGEYHGVAVVEAIRDMAPDAEIFIGQVTTLSDYQAIVDWFVANGVEIISRSLGNRYDGPGDGRGSLDEIASDAVSRGVLWVNSGGNSGSGKYYRQPVRLVGDRVAFGPSGTDTFLDFDGAVVLAGVRWANDWDLPAAQRTDYDIYLWESPTGSPASGVIIDSGTLRQRLGATPIEHLDDDHTPAAGNSLYLEVRLVAGDPTGDVLEILDYGSGISQYTQSAYSAAVSVVSSADPGVVAVGALSAAPSTAIAYYSSRGPTNDGRIAPDVAAPSSYYSTVFADVWGTTFSGTSAAAPVVSGGAALLLQAGLAADPRYLGDLIRHTTIDRGTAGPDSAYGHGQFVLPDPPHGVIDGPSTYVSFDVPRRVLDTRLDQAIGPPQLAGTMAPREIIDFPIASSAGLPGDATAVAINAVSIAPDAVSHLQILPTYEASVGGFSNLNIDAAGQVRANFAIVPLGQDGSISIQSIAGGDVLVDLLGYFRASPGPAGAGRFVALDQAERVLDSRYIAPIAPLASGEVRAVPLPTGVSLGDVRALVVTVTATGATNNGWVQVVPAGRPDAIGATSTINLAPGDTVANAAIVPIGPGGVALTSFFAQNGHAQVIVDVTGYITSSSTAPSVDGRFVPVRPDRAYDSRDHGGQLGDEVTVDVDARPLGVPADATGVMWNLTAANTTRAGHAVGWPTGGQEPSTSVLNWSAAGMIRASSAIVAVDTGRATFRVEDGSVDSPAPLTNFIVDVFGYFT